MSMLSKMVMCVILLLSMLLLAPIGTGEEDEACESCHSGFTIFPTELIGPLEVPVGVEFEMSLILTNPKNNDYSGDDNDDAYPHDLIKISAELNLSGSPNLRLNTGSLAIETSKVSSGAGRTIIWSLIASGPGLATISCDVTATAYYDHTSDDPDAYSYIVRPIDHILDVKPLPIRLSSYSLSTMTGQEREYEVVLSTTEPITDLSLSVSDEMIEFTNLTFPGLDNGTEDGLFPMALNDGEFLQFDLFLYSQYEGAEGALTITWVNFSGMRQSINLSISIIQPPTALEESINWFTILGQISGILLLGFFITSVLLGGFPTRTKSLFKKIGFKAGNRIQLHCTVSYFIIGLVLVHMLFLLMGPWGDSKFDGPVVLGYAGLFLFIALGVHGRFQRILIKKFGFKVWIWTHRFLTIGILILGLIHAFKIGTHFSFLRGM